MAPIVSVARTRADNSSSTTKEAAGFRNIAVREEISDVEPHEDSDASSVSSSKSFLDRFKASRRLTSISSGVKTTRTKNRIDARQSLSSSSHSSIRSLPNNINSNRTTDTKKDDPHDRMLHFSMQQKNIDESTHSTRKINEYSKTFQKYIKKKKYDNKRTSGLDSSRRSSIDNSVHSIPFLQASDHSLDDSSVASTESPHLLLLHDAKVALKTTWNVDFEEYNLNIEEPVTQVLLEDKEDAVLLMESWNKVLAFRSKFAEALLGRWRILVAAADISDRYEERQTDFEQQFWVHNIYETENNDLSSTRKLENEALRLVENNLDSLALHFGQRVADIGLILVSMLDMAVRSLCPHSQYVQREAYREMKGSKDEDNEVSDLFFHENECSTIQGFCEMLSSYGVKPEHWLLLCDAFLWAMKNQNPYSLDHEREDMNKMGAHANFISGMVALPLIESFGRRSIHIEKQEFEDLRDFISIEDDGIEDKIRGVVASAFSKLFAKIQDIEDHFSDVDIEEVSYYIFEV